MTKIKVKNQDRIPSNFNVFNLLIILLCSYQFYLIFQLQDKYQSLETKLNTLQNEKLKDNGILDKEPTPHAHYFNNIPTSDGLVPMNPEQEYTYEDFQSKFNIVYLENTEYDPDLDVILDGNELTSEQIYIDSKQVYDENTKFASDYLTGGPYKSDHMKKMVIKWSSKETGFGIFAKQDLVKDTILGSYTGKVNFGFGNADYVWAIPTKLIPVDPSQGKEIELGIDSSQAGNYLRFINHHDTGFNCKAILVPFDNRWYILYVTIRDIQKGEELLTNYGTKYFETR